MHFHISFWGLIPKIITQWSLLVIHVYPSLECFKWVVPNLFILATPFFNPQNICDPLWHNFQAKMKKIYIQLYMILIQYSLKLWLHRIIWWMDSNLVYIFCLLDFLSPLQIPLRLPLWTTFNLCFTAMSSTATELIKIHTSTCWFFYILADSFRYKLWVYLLLLNDLPYYTKYTKGRLCKTHKGKQREILFDTQRKTKKDLVWNTKVKTWYDTNLQILNSSCLMSRESQPVLRKLMWGSWWKRNGTNGGRLFCSLEGKRRKKIFCGYFCTSDRL